jgi:hypothetical protein
MSLEIFGPEFWEKYQRALAKAQEVPKTKLKKIWEFVKSNPPNEENDFHVKFDDLDILIVQAPRDTTKFAPVKTNAGNWKSTVIWAGSKSARGPFVSVFTAIHEDAVKLSSTPSKFWIIVGKMQQKEFFGDITYSFRLLGIIDPESPPE